MLAAVSTFSTIITNTKLFTPQVYTQVGFSMDPHAWNKSGCVLHYQDQPTTQYESKATGSFNTTARKQNQGKPIENTLFIKITLGIEKDYYYGYPVWFSREKGDTNQLMHGIIQYYNYSQINKYYTTTIIVDSSIRLSNEKVH